MKTRDSYGHILATEVDSTPIHLTQHRYNLINTYGVGLHMAHGFDTVSEIQAYLSEQGVPNVTGLLEPLQKLGINKNMVIKHPYKWSRYTITRSKK